MKNLRPNFDKLKEALAENKPDNLQSEDFKQFLAFFEASYKIWYDQFRSSQLSQKKLEDKVTFRKALNIIYGFHK